MSIKHNIYFSLWQFFGISCLFCLSIPIHALSLALIISNGGYEHGKINNTVNDAKEIAKTLRQKGFKVIEGFDQNEQQMTNLIYKFEDEFKKKLPTAQDVVLFYFGGHALQAEDERGMQYFLLPIGHRITRESDIPYNGVYFDRVLRIMRKYEKRGYTSIIVLDTCHEKPYPNSPSRRNCAVPTMILPAKSFIANATNQKVIKNRCDGNPYQCSSKYAKNFIQGIKTAIQKCQTIDYMFKTISWRTGKWNPPNFISNNDEKSYFPGCSTGGRKRENRPKAQEPLQSRVKVKVTVWSNVEGAMVFVGGRHYGSIKNGKKTIKLPVGLHTVRVKKRGYATVEKEINLVKPSPQNTHRMVFILRH